MTRTVSRRVTDCLRSEARRRLREAQIAETATAVGRDPYS